MGPASISTSLRRAALPLCLGLATFAAPAGIAAQTLETETARLLPKGGLTVSGNYEFQTSSEGKELALPIAVELGLNDRLEFLVEPVPYTSIRPGGMPRATGAGDLELTVTYLLHGGGTALAFAGEAKVPTARNALIGTQKTDYTMYLIASRTRGRASTHANIGYALLGKPAGVQLNNIFNFALAEEVRLNASSHLFGEVLASTSSGMGEGEGSPNPGAPVVSELAGSEVVGTFGAAYVLVPGFEVSLSVSYDNNQAVLLRSGFTYRLW
jgi:hypothetical protein